jgi:DNA-binding CsgD family transcriptional regulator
VNKYIKHLLFFALLFGNDVYCQQAVLSGQLKLDSTWQKKIYISQIPDFNQMFTASGKLIIAEANIDSAGKFKISFTAPKGETLYRLHIAKRNEPAATLIIGSEDENYVFFVAKDTSQVYFMASGNGKILNQTNIKDSKANDELNNLLTLISDNSITRDSLKNQFVATAEKSNSELVGLLAVYSAFGLDVSQKGRIQSALKRYNKENIYGTRIFEEYKSKESRVLIVLLIIILLLAGSLLAYKEYKKRGLAKIIHSLSHREVNIVRLILDGKSNKEIAAILNIEISTVKTHVNNIYAKLQIGNRKELVKYQEMFQNKKDIS